MKHAAVYVTGSIAAYKAAEVVRALQKRGYQVRVAETADATQLVAPATFAALTKHRVLTDLWEPTLAGAVPHIELADWTDIAVVVPATANIIAKLAQGIADDAVSTALVATSAPLVVVPAMNVHMWKNPATQRNLRLLRNDGRLVMEPTTGYLAEGYRGKGRMPAVNDIADFIDAAVQPPRGALAGKHLLITLGGTREPVDPVRFLGNRSSGKMGVAIARAAAAAGAQVTMIAAQVSVDLPTGPQWTIKRVETTAEMAAAVKKELSSADVLVMTAAVADFRAVQPAQQKIKKVPGKHTYQLTLEPTTDILKMAGNHRHPGQLIVGFAAETTDLVAHAKQKLAGKHADLIVANDVSNSRIGFGSDENAVTILRRDGQIAHWPQMSKAEVGRRLIALISRLIGKGD